MAKHFIDITKDHCPMTFVKVRIELGKIRSGEELEVLLQGAEPLKNVPRSAMEQGYTIKSIRPEGAKHRLIIAKP